MDGNTEDRSDTVSVFNGPPPVIRILKDESEEIGTVGNWIGELAKAGVMPHEFGIFAQDGQFVGGCGLNQFSSLNKLCNLGYWVRQSRQRSGAATAATRALRDLGLNKLGLARIEIVVAQGNEASLGVARKAGATYECLAQGRLQLYGKAVAAHVLSFTSLDKCIA